MGSGTSVWSLRSVVVVKGVACVLIHTPGLVPHGSKPARELAKDQAVGRIRDHLRGFEQAVAYPPNQAFIGNLRPESLFDVPRPWWTAVGEAPRNGPFGEIMSEEE